MGLKDQIRKYVGADVELEEVRLRLQQAEARASQAELRAKNYFTLIERLEKQRNEWKDMWFAQLGEHQAAQALLENAVVGVRQLLAGAVNEINMHRKKSDIPLITSMKDLRSPPVGVAAEYEKKMKELEEHAPVDLDVNSELTSLGNTGVLES